VSSGEWAHVYPLERHRFSILDVELGLRVPPTFGCTGGREQVVPYYVVMFPTLRAMLYTLQA